MILFYCPYLKKVRATSIIITNDTPFFKLSNFYIELNSLYICINCKLLFIKKSFTCDKAPHD